MSLMCITSQIKFKNKKKNLPCVISETNKPKDDISLHQTYIPYVI